MEVAFRRRRKDAARRALVGDGRDEARDGGGVRRRIDRVALDHGLGDVAGALEGVALEDDVRAVARVGVVRRRETRGAPAGVDRRAGGLEEALGARGVDVADDPRQGPAEGRAEEALVPEVPGDGRRERAVVHVSVDEGLQDVVREARGELDGPAALQELELGPVRRVAAGVAVRGLEEPRDLELADVLDEGLAACAGRG